MASFILPLTVASAWCPPIRRWFPELGWVTGTRRGAQVVQVYLTLSFAAVMAMNPGGPVNLIINLAVALVVLGGLGRMARPGFAALDARPFVWFGRWGFAGLCAYLTLVYRVMY